MCSPRSGPTLRMGSEARADHRHDAGESDGPAGRSPPVSTSKSWIMFRAAYCSSARCRRRCRWVPTAPRPSSSSASASSRNAAIVHSPIAASSSSRRSHRPALVCNSGSVSQIGPADDLHVSPVDRVAVACDDNAGAVGALIGVARCDALHPAADAFPFHPVRQIVRNQRLHHRQDGFVERHVDDPLSTGTALCGIRGSR